MRQLSAGRAYWLKNSLRRLAKREIRNANFRRHGTVRFSGSHYYKTAVLLVPSQLVAETENRRSTITDVILKLQAKLSNGQKVKLDFTHVNQVLPGGMLYLIAHLQWLCDLYPNRIKAAVPPRSMVAQLLVHFGMAGRLKIDPIACAPKAKSVVQWQYRTGTQADGSPVRAALEEYRTKSSWTIPDDLYAVISEGIDNVADHAYKLQTWLPAKWQQWWLFACLVEPSDDEPGGLYVALYDLGSGIPATMKTKLTLGEFALDVYDTVTRAFTLDGTALEERLLHHAIERRRSSTGDDHRGRGLPEMRHFIENIPNGAMYVVSGTAEYRYITGKINGEIRGCRSRFPGTLLLWSMPLTTREVI